MMQGSHKPSRATVAGAVLALLLSAMGSARADEAADRRMSECFEAGYAPGSGMFAACLQDGAHADGLGVLDTPSAYQGQIQEGVELPQSEKASPLGAPGKLLGESYTTILDTPPVRVGPAWDWNQ